MPVVASGAGNAVTFDRPARITGCNGNASTNFTVNGVTYSKHGAGEFYAVAGDVVSADQNWTYTTILL